MKRLAWLLSLVVLSVIMVAALSFAQWSGGPDDGAAAGGAAGGMAQAELAGMMGGGGAGGPGGRMGGRRGGMAGGMAGEHACAMGLSLSRSELVVDHEDIYQVYAGRLIKLDRKLNIVKEVDLPGVMPAGAEAQPHAAGAFLLPSLKVENLDVYVTAGGTICKYDRNLNVVAQRALPMPAETQLAQMCPMQMMGGGMMGGGAGGGMRGMRGG